MTPPDFDLPFFVTDHSEYVAQLKARLDWQRDELQVQYLRLEQQRDELQVQRAQLDKQQGVLEALYIRLKQFGMSPYARRRQDSVHPVEE